MSFEQRDYLRHIVVEADYLLARSASLTFDAFTGDETLRRAFVPALASPGEPSRLGEDLLGRQGLYLSSLVCQHLSSCTYRT